MIIRVIRYEASALGSTGLFLAPDTFRKDDVNDMGSIHEGCLLRAAR